MLVARWYEQIEAFVHNGRAFALAGLGKSGPAMDEFEVSIRMSPENAWVYHNRGQVHDRAGNRDKASADYQKALTKKNPALSPTEKRTRRRVSVSSQIALDFASRAEQSTWLVSGHNRLS